MNNDLMLANLNNCVELLAAKCAEQKSRLETIEAENRELRAAYSRLYEEHVCEVIRRAYGD